MSSNVSKVAALSAIGLFVIIATACGGSSSDGTLSVPGDGGTASETGATGTNDSGGEPYTLDNVCERTATVICEIRKPCCESAVGFDLAGCLAHSKAECAADVAEARAGREQFHPERITDCIPKFREIYASCNLTVQLVQKYSRTLSGCAIFTGERATDAPCDRAAQCKPGGPDEFIGCDDKTKLCKATSLTGEGKPCSLADGLPIICDAGLYCDVDLGSDAGKLEGTCKKETALTSPCTKVLECGFGRYCAPETKLCSPGKGGGAKCSDNLECASVSCDKVAKTCAPLASIAKPEECKGP